MGICKIDSNGYWTVDGESIYTPTATSVTNNRILSADSKRAESGKQYLTWIRPKYTVIKLTYNLITAEEVAFLHEKMQGRDFDFTYLDGEVKSIRAFSRKDSYSQYRLDSHKECGGLYKNYTIEIEEV